MKVQPIPDIELGLPRFLELKSLQPVWYYAAIAHFAVMFACYIAGLADDRTFNDVSVWHKPFKFALSLGVYFLTLLWFAKYVHQSALTSRRGRALVAIPVIMAVFEMGYILLMAALGQASHFNYSTPFHIFMYGLMGFGAVSLVLVLPWLGLLVARNNALSNPLIFAIVAGLTLTLILGGGFGGYLSANAGHWVNAPATDANGVWLFNWSTQGGDLRVAHFFGMHVMQVLPLFAWVLPKNWSTNSRLALVVAFACAYSAFSAVTFLQAIQGQPFL